MGRPGWAPREDQSRTAVGMFQCGWRPAISISRFRVSLNIGDLSQFGRSGETPTLKVRAQRACFSAGPSVYRYAKRFSSPSRAHRYRYPPPLLPCETNLPGEFGMKSLRITSGSHLADIQEQRASSSREDTRAANWIDVHENGTFASGNIMQI